MMSRRVAVRIASLVSLATLSLAQSGVNLAEAAVLESAAASPLEPLQVWENEGLEGEQIMNNEATSVTSVLATIHDTLKARVSKPEDQLVNAWVAFIVGVMLLLVDCRAIFKWFGVAGFMVFAGLMAMNEVKARWLYGYQSGAGSVIAVEVGLVAGYAALRGFQGLMMLVGALVGALLARLAQNFIANFGIVTFEVDQAPIVIWYSVFIFASVFATFNDRRIPLLAFASPLIGGALVSSSVCWFVTGLMRPFHLAPWVDFLLMLSSSKNKDVGPYAGSGELHKDRWCGLGFWAVLFALGVFRQNMILRKSEP